MGMLVDGVWTDEDRTIQDGAYVRPASPYGKPLDATTVAAIVEEPGRFHLIASLSCPWSHRTMLMRVLKGLVDVVPLHIAGGPRTEGYRVGAPGHPWSVPGDGPTIVHLHELYAFADAAYTRANASMGRVNQLIGRIDGNADLKASVDYNTRMLGEIAVLLNETLRVQAAAANAAGTDALSAARDRAGQRTFMRAGDGG